MVSDSLADGSQENDLPPHPAKIVLPNNATLLDVNTKVAGFVSNPGSIDAILDDMRIITAQRTAKDLTPGDIMVLSRIYDELETYLVEREPFRTFTRMSVRRLLYSELTGNTSARHRNMLIIIWAVALGLTAAVLLSPTALVSAAIKPTLAPTLFMAMLHVGAAWLFWAGLTNFKPDTRRAYWPVCIGILAIGISLLQVPAVNFWDYGDSVWFRYIMASLPITVGLGLIYIGVRRFSRIAQVSGRFASVRLLLATIVAISAGLMFLPASEPQVAQWVRAVSLIVLVSGAAFSLFAAGIAARMSRSFGLTYRRPMFWLGACMLVSALACVQFILLQTIIPFGSAYEASGLSALPLVITSFLILKAGGTFKRIDPI